jgi:uncharacterized membrane protein YeaQ/YmgE (transglycosylase-associated protein family)
MMAAAIRSPGRFGEVFMLHYIRMFFVGLITGLLASFVYNRFDPGVHLGVVKGAVVGIAGSYVFGLIGKLLHPSAEPLHPAHFLYSILGSVALIFVGHKLLPGFI